MKCTSCRLNLCALVVTCLTIFYGIAQATSSYGSVDDPQASSVQAMQRFVLTFCWHAFCTSNVHPKSLGNLNARREGRTALLLHFFS